MPYVSKSFSLQFNKLTDEQFIDFTKIMPFSSIAAKFNVGIRTVSHRAKKLMISPIFARGGLLAPIGEIERNKMIYLHDHEGLTYHEIGKIMNRHYETVRFACNPGPGDKWREHQGRTLPWPTINSDEWRALNGRKYEDISEAIMIRERNGQKEPVDARSYTRRSSPHSGIGCAAQLCAENGS